MSHEVHNFIACSTCRFAIREPDPDDDTITADKPCPQCGWTLIEIGYVLLPDGDVTVNTEWNDGDSAPLNLTDAAHALTAVQDLIESECEAQDATTAKRSRLNELRLARQEREDQ